MGKGDHGADCLRAGLNSLNDATRTSAPSTLRHASGDSVAGDRAHGLREDLSLRCLVKICPPDLHKVEVEAATLDLPAFVFCTQLVVLESSFARDHNCFMIFMIVLIESFRALEVTDWPQLDNVTGYRRESDA